MALQVLVSKLVLHPVLKRQLILITFPAKETLMVCIWESLKFATIPCQSHRTRKSWMLLEKTVFVTIDLSGQKKKERQNLVISKRQTETNSWWFWNILERFSWRQNVPSAVRHGSQHFRNFFYSHSWKNNSIAERPFWKTHNSRKPIEVATFLETSHLLTVLRELILSQNLCDVSPEIF